MQLALSLFTKIGTLAQTAVGGVAGSAAASTGAALVGTAVSTVGAVSALSMQKAAMDQAAQVEEQNALLARERGQARAQDQDFELAALLSEDQATYSTSGLATGSGSFMATRSRRQVIGRTSRLRAIYDAELQGINAESRAAADRTEARSFGTQSVFRLVSGGLDLGNDLLSGAAMTRTGVAANTQRRRVAI